MARTIREAGVGTLLFDLLTQEEEAVDISTRHLLFDIGLLAGRLVDATNRIKREPDSWHLRVGYFGSSTGGAALVAAASVAKRLARSSHVADDRILLETHCPKLSHQRF